MLKKTFFAAALLWLTAAGCLAQERDDIVQLSGVVVGEDSLGLPGVHIYVPRSGRGTISNNVGYFSIPILRSDSLIISCVGYQHQRYAVPESETRDQIAIIVHMQPSLTRLEGVEITTFPTEEAFKGAVLALNLPEQGGMKLGIFDSEDLAMIVRANPMDSYSNYRYYSSQYSQAVDDKFRGRTNPFLNPFNWYYFFRDLKKKKNADKKK